MIRRVFLVCLLCIGAWFSYAGALSLAGDGTADAPFEIADAKAFAELVNAFTAGETDGDLSIVLTDDLDFTGVPFSPLGTAEKPFRGTLDGGGHAMRGIAIRTTPQTVSGVSLGVIGCADGACVYDLTVEEMSVEISTNVSGTAICAGLLCGSAAGEGITVERCGASGSIHACAPYGRLYIGGLVGRMKSDAERARFCLTNAYADVSSGGRSRKNAFFGGLIGSLEATGDAVRVKNCRTAGTMTVTGGGSSGFAGGFAGFTHIEDDWSGWLTEATPENAVSHVENSVFAAYGTSDAVVSHVGALCGSSDGLTVSGCFSPYAASGDGSLAFADRAVLCDPAFWRDEAGFDLMHVWAEGVDAPMLRGCSPKPVYRYTGEKMTLAVIPPISGGRYTAIVAFFDEGNRMADAFVLSKNENRYTFTLKPVYRSASVFFINETTLSPVYRQVRFPV